MLLGHSLNQSGERALCCAMFADQDNPSARPADLQAACPASVSVVKSAVLSNCAHGAEGGPSTHSGGFDCLAFGCYAAPVQRRKYRPIQLRNADHNCSRDRFVIPAAEHTLPATGRSGAVDPNCARVHSLCSAQSEQWTLCGAYYTARCGIENPSDRSMQWW
jgi:hypothetical protein